MGTIPCFEKKEKEVKADDSAATQKPSPDQDTALSTKSSFASTTASATPDAASRGVKSSNSFGSIAIGDESDSDISTNNCHHHPLPSVPESDCSDGEELAMAAQPVMTNAAGSPEGLAPADKNLAEHPRVVLPEEEGASRTLSKRTPMGSPTHYRYLQPTRCPSQSTVLTDTSNPRRFEEEANTSGDSHQPQESTPPPVLHRRLHTEVLKSHGSPSGHSFDSVSIPETAPSRSPDVFALSDVDTLRRRVTTTEAELDRTVRANSDIGSRFLVTNKENVELKRALDLFQEASAIQVEAVTQRLKAAEADVMTLMEERDRLSEEVKGFPLWVSQLESDLADKTEAVEALESEQRSLKKHLDSALERIRREQHSRAKLERVNKAWKRKVTSLKSKLSSRPAGPQQRSKKPLPGTITRRDTQPEARAPMGASNPQSLAPAKIIVL